MILANYPGHLAAAGLILALAGLVVLAYRSRNLRNARFWRWPLAIMQFAALVVVAVILWDPSRPLYKEEVTHNTVVAVFDTSESMSVRDGASEGLSRLDLAIKTFQERFAPSDPDGPVFRILGFDNTAYEVSSTDELRRWGEQTQLRRAMGLLNACGDTAPEAGTIGEPAGDAEAAATRVVGAVVFTDGQANSKFADTYPPGNDDLDILIVGVGQSELHGDIAVRSIEAPATVQIDSAYTVTVQVQADDLDPSGADVILVEVLKDGASVGVQEIDTQDMDAGFATVEFKLGADVLGEQVLSARASGLANEVNRGNNVRGTMVNVVEEPTSRILFYSQVVNFDIGKVRQALLRDKKATLDFGLDAVVDASKAGADAPIQGMYRLPEDRQGFYAYDVIVLGPCALDDMTQEQVEGLYSFVADRGGGLMLLPGRDAYDVTRVRNKTLRALLPVLADPQSGAATESRPKGPPQATLVGQKSSVFAKADFAAQPLVATAYYSPLSSKPAATALVNVVDTPLITAHRVGRGRVCLLNAHRLCEWYREDLDGGILTRVLSNLTAYVGRVPERESGVEVFAKRKADAPHEVRFDADIYDESYRPVDEASVLLYVGSDVVRMDPSAHGQYTATITGIQTEAIVARVSAERQGVFLGERTITASLPLPRTEMAHVELDEDFLESLTDRVGAEYVHLSDLDDSAPDRFEGTSKVNRVQDVVGVWQRWPVLVGLCVLLSVMWFIRRAVGLA